MERNSEEEGISGATCKASSYCDSASSNCPSPNNLFPSNFASFACSKAFASFSCSKAFCFKTKIEQIQVYFIFWR